MEDEMTPHEMFFGKKVSTNMQLAIARIMGIRYFDATSDPDVLEHFREKGIL